MSLYKVTLLRRFSKQQKPVRKERDIKGKKRYYLLLERKAHFYIVKGYLSLSGNAH